MNSVMKRMRRNPNEPRKLNLVEDAAPSVKEKPLADMPLAPASTKPSPRLSAALLSLIVAAVRCRPLLKDQDHASQLRRVRAHDYRCVAEGGVFVAENWLGDELLQALRADAHALLRDGHMIDADEPIGKRLKVELRTARWTAPGETEPSEARAAAR